MGGIPDAQRIFIVHKPPGAATYFAKIKIAGGKHEEDYDTGQKSPVKARYFANRHVRHLYKTLGIESPIQYKRRTGSKLSLWSIRRGITEGNLEELEKKVKAHRALGLAAPKKTGRPPKYDEPVDEPVDEPPERQSNGRTGNDWSQSLFRIENKFAQAFQRILSLCLLGVGDDDPQTFRDHVRAIVTETTLAGLTPTGRLQRKRGRPPGV